MTVTELINQLTELQNEGFGNTELVLSVTDHTDWDYNLPLREQDVYVDKIWDIEEANFEDGELPGEDEEYLIIDLNFE